MNLYVEEEGSGHPLLLLTGLGYAIWSWQRQLPEWSQRFRCIAVENRGTGRSPKPPGPYSIEEMADDAAEMLEGRRAHVRHENGLTLARRVPDASLPDVCRGRPSAVHRGRTEVQRHGGFVPDGLES